MLTNEDRAIRAETAVIVATDYSPSNGEDLETGITDLLANLMHLVAREELNWEGLLERAERHFTAEYR